MGKLKQLASQTFIYGMSSIVGRIINYFLVPLYTNCFPSSEYGIVVEMYTYSTFLLIILTYGMETGFFNFAKSEKDPNVVYTTSLTALLSTSSLFILLGVLFAPDIAHSLDYDNHVNYISLVVITLGLDALIAVPFARLRQQNKALKFALFKLTNIFLNVFLNLFFILWLPKLAQSYEFFTSIYSKDFGVGYIFLANVIASAVTFLMFVPDLLKVKYRFDSQFFKRMLAYSLPLLISGLAGTINDFFDRIAIKYFYTVPDGIADANAYILSEVGIYGANAKLAVIMTLFISCFRYAADPFFFSNKGSDDFDILFARVNKYLVLFGVFIFLGIMGFLDILKYFIASSYWDGLSVVPFLLIGHWLVGLVYLQSFWYKLSNKTVCGIYIFLIGSVLTIVLDYLLVPKFGYIACAVTNVVSSLVMLLITYFWGRNYLPCQYDFRNIAIFVALGGVCYYLITLTDSLPFVAKLSVNSLIIIAFASIVIKVENLWQPLKNFANKLLKR
ncbi:MAG: oligosaccharide flippase family protein [Bacteroidales bacterium]|nr:oligosaccharide flippase family protein [Bacteroidales bacterium]